MAASDVKRHPIRGALWGLLFGLGLYFLLVGRKVVALGSLPQLILIMAAGVVVNVLWSLFAPAKRAKAPKGWVATTGMPIAPAVPMDAGMAAGMGTPPPPPEPGMAPPPEPGIGSGNEMPPMPPPPPEPS